MSGEIYFALTALLAFFLILRIKFTLMQKRNILINEKKNQLKSLYKNEAVFLCNFIEKVEWNLLQLHGESFNSPLSPGMSLEIDGVGYIIKRVYADDETPLEPNAEVAAGVSDTPIIIEKGMLNLNSFRQELGRKIVIPLKLK
ncbi:MAG TPA: hypothetical protein VJC01_03825 [Candidatus Paceibacterota bacterium]